VAPGDIASWEFPHWFSSDDYHSEIVTSVNDGEYFGSRGAGRGGPVQGTEKCGGKADTESLRAIREDNIKFYRYK
jgi:hypothetical protein